MAFTLRHGSHDHSLQHMGTMEASVVAANCGACDLHFTSGNDLFWCGSCGFFLHQSCFLLPPSIPQHPAHPQRHQLHLLYAPASGSSFHCYICGDRGQGFNYHCSEETCQFDAHVLCVNLLPKKRSPAHQHGLQLQFRPPPKGRISCGVCGLQIQYCCYSCSRCSLFLHPQCLNRQPNTGCSNKQQGPQRGPTKHNRQNLVWEVTKRVAKKVSMHFLLDAFGGWGEAVDVLLFGPEDLEFLRDCFSNLPVDTIFPGGNGDSSGLDVVTVDDLSDCIDEADDSLQSETSSSATEPPSTSSSNIGTITKEHAP